MAASLTGPRRPKRTADLVEAALQVLKLGHSQRAAAAHIKISRSTWHRWMQVKSFAEQVHTASDAFEGYALTKIVAAAATDWKALAWILERTRPADYGVRVSVDVREIATRVARETGLDDVEALIVEAERIATGKA